MFFQKTSLFGIKCEQARFRWPSGLGRRYVYDCCGATKTSPHSNRLATYVKEGLSPSTKKHSNSVMGYRVCQLILCHKNILIIGEQQSLRIKQLGQAENSIVSNVC